MTSPLQHFATTANRAVKTALSLVHIGVPTHKGAAAPQLGPGAFGHGLGSHVVLGFVPSWELGDVTTLDYSALTEVAYYALVVRTNGTIDRSGYGWSDLADGEVGGLVTDAHDAGVRVLLTLYCGYQPSLQSLSAHPGLGVRLADEVAPLLANGGFDGVDLDFEGELASARTGFAHYVAAFSNRLKSINDRYDVVLNAYPEAAAGPDSFYDLPALDRYVDQFFVMDYDMTDLEVPGSTAPLTGSVLSDTTSIASFVAAVPPKKVILGIPFYGYDFTLNRKAAPADLVRPAYAVTYDSVVASGHLQYWDPSSETPYLSFPRGGRWHETFFEDPSSVGLKVALATAYGLDGVGAWELGMADGKDAMTAALDGGSPPLRLPLVR